MQRVNTPEILDSNTCPKDEVETSLQDLCRINRWFAGVATTRMLIEDVASAVEESRECDGWQPTIESGVLAWKPPGMPDR